MQQAADPSHSGIDDRSTAMRLALLEGKYEKLQKDYRGLLDTAVSDAQKQRAASDEGRAAKAAGSPSDKSQAADEGADGRAANATDDNFHAAALERLQGENTMLKNRLKLLSSDDYFDEEEEDA